MTTTAHEDQFTSEPEPARQQYSTADILRRNVADLEIALRKQTERAEAAEKGLAKKQAILAKLREQKPIKYLYRVTDCFGHDVLRDSPKGAIILETIPLYGAPVPAPAVPESNPVQWLEDEGDNILVPRGLLGAACSAIENKRQADKVVAALRHYTKSAVPVVPEEWREVMAELAADLQACIEAEHAYRDQYSSVMRKYQNDMRIVERARALLQSAGGGK